MNDEPSNHPLNDIIGPETESELYTSESDFENELVNIESRRRIVRGPIPSLTSEMEPPTNARTFVYNS